MTCIILIQMIEERYTVDILIYKTILPYVDNKLIKGNFKDLVTLRIKSILFRCLRLTCFMKLKKMHQ